MLERGGRLELRGARGARRAGGLGGVILAKLLAGCMATVPPPPPPPVEPATLAPFPAEIVWTATGDVSLHGADDRVTVVERPFTRLEAVGHDSLGLHVRCEECDGSPEGIVSPGAVVYRPIQPEVAAWGTAAEFALAIRAAVEAGDLGSLRPVMAEEFSFSFVGRQSPEDAFAVWRSEEFATLERVPTILDRGLGTRDGRIWAAPPEFVDELTYRGPRIGFRQRVDGRWEWAFLIQGVVP